MSRRAFARMLEFPEGTVRNYEHGTSQPKFDALCQISQKLRISLDWLVFGEGAKMREGVAVESSSQSTDAEGERLHELKRRIAELEGENKLLKDTLAAKTDALEAYKKLSITQATLTEALARADREGSIIDAPASAQSAPSVDLTNDEK